MCKSQLLEYAVDARHGNVVRELAHENRRHQSHADGEVEDGLEIVLLDKDGAGGAHLEAIAAVDTTVGNQNGLAVAHAQRLSGANLHAARTAYAGVLVDFQGVEKRNLVHIVEIFIRRSQLLVVESLNCLCDTLRVEMLCIRRSQIIQKSVFQNLTKSFVVVI